MRFMNVLLCAGGLLAPIGAVQAQTTSFAIEARGGVALPTGDWNESDEVGTGFGFGGNVQAMFSPTLGVYAGWETYAFPLDTDLTGVETDLTDAGFRGGLVIRTPVPANPSIASFVEVGAVYSQTTLEATSGGTSGEAESDAALGFDVAVGVEVPVGPRIGLTPAFRFRSHEAEFDIVGDATTVQYFLFDVGLRVRL